MKISIDKNTVTLAQAAAVRADIKEFKARYTDGDLLRAFVDFTGIDAPSGGEVLKATAEAFCACGNTHFMVELYVFSFGRFCVCSFFCDMGLTVDTEERDGGLTLYSCDVYRNT